MLVFWWAPVLSCVGTLPLVSGAHFADWCCQNPKRLNSHYFHIGDGRQPNSVAVKIYPLYRIPVIFQVEWVYPQYRELIDPGTYENMLLVQRSKWHRGGWQGGATFFSGWRKKQILGFGNSHIISIRYIYFCTHQEYDLKRLATWRHDNDPHLSIIFPCFFCLFRIKNCHFSVVIAGFNLGGWPKTRRRSAGLTDGRIFLENPSWVYLRKATRDPETNSKRTLKIDSLEDVCLSLWVSAHFQGRTVHFRVWLLGGWIHSFYSSGFSAILWESYTRLFGNVGLNMQQSAWWYCSMLGAIYIPGTPNNHL